MNLFFICFILFVCGVVSATQTNALLNRSKVNCKGKKGLGITGGTPASIKKFPYQAAIFYEDEFHGSGSIVGKKYILTSAFLVKAHIADNLQVRVGSANSAAGGQFIDVESVTIHEKFDNLFSYDVALLKLSKEIEYGNTAKPIKLASKKPKNSTTAVVSGFAAPEMQMKDFISETLKKGTTLTTLRKENDLANDLKKGKQRVVDKDSCQYFYDFLKLDESDICAFSRTACACTQADFGAPLVQKNKLIGYFTGGSFCCYDTNPQIYNDAANIHKWVQEHMQIQGYDVKEDIDHYYRE